MTLRTGHGTGAGSPRIEALPPDELPMAAQVPAVRPQRGRDGCFLPGNTVGKGKRLRPRQVGSVAFSRAAPRYRPFAAWAARYAAHRRAELARLHGGHLSTGAAVMIESAALDLAASRYVAMLAAEQADPELLRLASTLAQTARQHELAAWELAAREGPVAARLEECDAQRRRIEAIISEAESP